MKKVDKIKLQYFLNWFTEFNSIIEAQLRSGEEWPLMVDIDQDTSIPIKKYEWEKAKEAHEFYST